ncbi:substrate-binding domain-containing protein [Mycobacterium spongiae]|uniref:VWFA domain-containing protein n=1 Tax=Mycobacterium spongiae TaxID=886343 RepID=A0A975JYV0_9MYCO|nr:substrate-binding domain-containing protein [Mycobacterium spongiae]QUR67594.1 hypothetical protein F6B93_11230 [Mycobacterium spongiae]
MGRHSKPDPEDSADEPSDEDPAEQHDRGYQLDDHGADLQAGSGFDEAAAEPTATDQLTDPLTDNNVRAGDEPPTSPQQSGYGSYPDATHPTDAGHYPAAGAYAPAGAGEYPDFSSPPAGSEPAGPDPSAIAPPPLRAGHRGLGESQGGHRGVGGRRGVSIGVIVAFVTVIVVVAGVILWSFFGDALSNRSHTAAASCVGGNDTVAVIADASIAGYVKDFADSYNASAGPIGDRCVAVAVKPAGSDAVVGGFIGEWPSDLGSRPGLWIPASSISAARLSAAAGPQTISDSRPLVTSPVLVAVRPELQPALANQDWAALPGLQSTPDSLAALDLPTWGSLRLALPIAGNADASLLAGEAIAAASAPAGASPTAGIGAVRTLMSAQPKLADDSLTEAMNALLKPGDSAAAPVHAVVTTEQALFERGQSLSDAKNTLSFWLPPGPVAVADYPTVLLGGSWLSQEQTTAASAFSRYMHKPEQLAKLAEAGFRVNDVEPPASPVTSFPALSSTLSVGDEATRATLADSMGAPSNGVAATIMLDQSMPQDEGGKSRLDNVIAALENRIRGMPPSAVVGLWTFDGQEGRTEVPAGPLADPVDGQPRSEALTAALNKQYSSNGGAVSFTTLRLIYQDMLANYHDGQANSILVITAGPHTDQTLDGPGLQDFIRTSADPAKPIAVNIIDFGDDPDRATWEAVAQLSGGTYQNLSTSASPDLATAVTILLG